GAGARGLERRRGNRSDRRAALTTSGDSPMPLAPQSFLYRHDPHTGVATITLNRPDRLNALTFDVYRELRDTFRTLDDEPGVRAVIAAGCDVRVAAECAKIAFLFTKVGLSGADMGAAWLLPRIVGLGLAAELLMTGDFIDAQTALRIGLYNRVVAQAEVMGEAGRLAERLARGPSAALGITKDALNREAHMDLVAALEAEARAQAGCMLSPNFRAA